MNTTEDKINQELEDGTLIKADTLEVLAQKLNIDATTFVNTIERYNTFVELGHDEDFNKNAFDLKSKKHHSMRHHENLQYIILWVV